MSGDNINKFCSKRSAPIEIKDTDNTCESRCNFRPKYSASGITCTNMSEYLEIKLNLINNEIEFNNEKYRVLEMRLYSKPLHKYHTVNPIGEILIIHEPLIKNMDNTLLVVSIPVIQSNSNSITAILFEQVLKESQLYINRNLLSSISTTGSELRTPPLNMNSTSFDLSILISQTPYYYYKGIFGFQLKLGNCNKESNIIVFDTPNSSINIFSDSEIILNKLLINPNINEYKIQNITELFYNKKGPNFEVEDDIYINCQPVNSSTDKLYIPLDDSKTLNPTDIINKLNDLGDSPIMNVILGIIVLLLLYFIAESVLGKFKSSDANKISDTIKNLLPPAVMNI
tara:strand:- start:2169 stop:3194 length:1026 start_codon:yes stop_codon:yes gene_type:complete